MKGDIYYHSKFPFHDGQIGEKLFVVLNTPVKKEPYLVVKTTSQIKQENLIVGCNQSHGVFYVPKDNNSPFHLPTVLQLIEVYEFSPEEFLKGSLQEKTIVHKCTLPSLIMNQIVNCFKKLKDDISEKHFQMITK